MQQPETDVLIVGAGAAGSVAARRLAHEGFRVVCLEQGDWPDRSALLTDGPEAELSWYERWNPDPNVRANEADYPVVAGDCDVRPGALYNGVGGGMVMWAAMWQPMIPSDFRVHSLDGVADDWPLTFDELRPYYERAATEMGVSGLGDDPAYPQMAAPPNPPLPIGHAGRAAVQGMNRLGWHWWPGSNAIASRKYRQLEPCQLRGTCMVGCPEDAKATPGRVHWPHALEDGARLITGARVTEITTGSRGRVTGATYIDRDGQHHHQAAPVVILAANAVGTARLLLLSTSPAFPDGLANRSGLVGRRLMQHPYATVTAVLDEPLYSWRGPAGQLLYSLQFAETDTARGFVRGAKWMVMPGGGPIFAYNANRNGRPGAGFDELWGAGFHAAVRRTLGRSFLWGIQTEDLPDVENRVMLDPDVTDSDGLPAPRIEYRLSENTRRMLEFNIARAVEACEAAGARETLIEPLWPGGIGHVLGTTRMGENPATSVVDPWGRSHDVPNLYVIDSSVFVTGGSMNPGATILALAHRCVDEMIRTRSWQEVPV